MGLTTSADAIRSFIHTRWGVVGDGSELVPENVNFKPSTGQKFVAYQIRPIETLWVSPGWSDSIGSVLFSSYAPIGTGPETAEELLELAVSTVRFQKTGDVQFEDASVEAIGPDDDGRFIVNGRVPYHYQERATS